LVLSICFVDDTVVSVNQMFLQFVGKDSFKGVDLEFFSDIGNHLSNNSVACLFLDASKSGLLGVISSENNISLSSVNLCSSNNDSVCGLSYIPVNVASEINLSDVSFSKDR